MGDFLKGPTGQRWAGTLAGVLTGILCFAGAKYFPAQAMVLGGAGLVSISTAVAWMHGKRPGDASAPNGDGQ